MTNDNETLLTFQLYYYVIEFKKRILKNYASPYKTILISPYNKHY